MDKRERTNYALHEYGLAIRSGQAAYDPREAVRIIERHGNKEAADQMKQGMAGEGCRYGDFRRSPRP